MASRIVQRLALTFVLQIALGGCVLAQSTAMAPPPTFSKDVAPILQKNCQTCHRPGEGGPFSLLTYDDARPMAFSIKRVVSQKIMPPWYADPKFGHFSNERSLSEKEIATLVAWANAGAPEGDKKDLPPPINWVEGWGIPKPDVIFQLPKPFQIPASGTIEYQYVIVPTGFTEDKWVQMAEARQGRATSRTRSRANFLWRRHRRKMKKLTPARCPAISWSATRPDSLRKSCSRAKRS